MLAQPPPLAHQAAGVDIHHFDVECLLNRFLDLDLGGVKSNFKRVLVAGVSAASPSR